MTSRIIPPLAAWLLARSLAAATNTPSFAITTDRPDGIYGRGEPVVFSIQLLENGTPVAGRSLSCTLKGDGAPEQLIPLTSTTGPVAVTGRLDGAGCLTLKVTGTDASGKPIPWWTLTGIAGAAVDPFGVRAAQAVPADFDAFWAEQKAALAGIPPDWTETAGTNIGLFRAWHVTSAIGTNLRPLKAMVTLPAGAAPKSLGARLVFPGAGIRSGAFQSETNTIVLTMNVHGIENLQPEAYYLSLRNGDLKDYTRAGAGRRDTYYFRGVFLRILRALEYVKARPEWDGKTLVVAGGSQGGGLALVAAGLDPAVSRCEAGMPALCDHLGYTRNQASGWPQLVVRNRKTGQPLDLGVVTASAYYDAANFATRIRADTEISTGLRDTTCPPATAFAAFNNLPCRTKTLWVYPEAGHMLQGRKVELHPEGLQP